MQIRSKWIKSEPMLEEHKNETPRAIALKPRIEIALNKISHEVTKLAYVYTELGTIEMKIRGSSNSISVNFDISGYGSSNHAELFQSRRRGMTALMSMISLETVACRLQTAKNINEVAFALTPSIAVMKSIRSALIRYVSSKQEEIAEICD